MLKVNLRHALAAGAATFLVPLSAYAGSAWSTVTVEQNQHVNGANADLIQSADVESSVWFGNQASAKSKASGDQALWINGKGGQKQKLATEAKLTWDDNEWPADAKASTKTAVGQWQHGWGPAKAKQQASIWEQSKIGNTKSQNDATIKQKTTTNGGDFSQDQGLKGKTKVTGLIDPPWWDQCGCGGNNRFGGKLITDVSVFVRSIFEF